MSGHVAPKSLYYLIFLTLMMGTGLTVLVAKFDLGPLNNIVMLSVACVKALLVILFFMHVLDSSRLTKLFVIGTFVWLGIMFILTFSDYQTRPWLPVSRGWNEQVGQMNSGKAGTMLLDRTTDEGLGKGGGESKEHE